jgi:hypothetical protein
MVPCEAAANAFHGLTPALSGRAGIDKAREPLVTRLIEFRETVAGAGSFPITSDPLSLDPVRGPGGKGLACSCFLAPRRLVGRS